MYSLIEAVSWGFLETPASAIFKRSIQNDCYWSCISGLSFRLWGSQSHSYARCRCNDFAYEINSRCVIGSWSSAPCMPGNTSDTVHYHLLTKTIFSKINLYLITWEFNCPLVRDIEVAVVDHSAARYEPWFWKGWARFDRLPRGVLAWHWVYEDFAFINHCPWYLRRWCKTNPANVTWLFCRTAGRAQEWSLLFFLVQTHGFLLEFARWSIGCNCILAI